MGQPTETYDSYDADDSVREDLSDIIRDVSPTKTPFLSAIETVKGTNKKHEWLTDTLAAASGSNFVIEGDDATTDATVAPVRVFNYRAISDKVASVSGSQEESFDKVARKTEMAREMKKRMKELKRDVETILLQNNAYVAGNATTASECAGLQAYVFTNANVAADATPATGDGSDAHTDGTARALQESFVEDALSQAWDEGGEPTLGVMNSFQKRKAAAFHGSSNKTSDGDSKKVVNTVDIYIDPLGNELRLMPCRQCPTDAIFGVDPEYCKFVAIRNFKQHDLAKTGDSYRKQIIVEYTLEVCNEKAHMGVYDLSAS